MVTVNNQVRQCIYVGFYKSQSNKMKIGETCQKVHNRARKIAKDDFTILWYAELRIPKKEAGLQAEEVLRQFFQSLGIEQLSTDHFKVHDAKNFIERNILDMKVYLREHGVSIGYEKFAY